MDLAPILDLPALGSLLAALVYTAAALRVLRFGGFRRAAGRTSLAFAAALVCSALWGWSGFAEQSLDSISPRIVAVADLARYGCWYAFLLSLLAPAIAQRQRRGIKALVPLAALLLTLGVATVAMAPGPSAPGPSAPSVRGGQFALVSALALPVFGMVLVEQLFRNLADDSRWNAKPLCLGLSVIFLFDVYVYSQAVLFGRLDADAVSIRGAIHALAVPVLFMASRRRNDWISRLRISRAAAFHSAALVLIGVYLLIVAAIGYYIRYFGGEWGHALQLVALTAALIALAMLALSGAMRSRLRVLVGKHFFSYRYDYREEWLRFTTMLSAQSAHAGTGVLVIRGLADLVESPAGALWMLAPGEPEFVQTARWNAPAIADHEPVDTSFVNFLRTKGWVVDLDRHRAGTEHYDDLTLPAWLAAARQFWLVIPLLVGDELIGFVTLASARTPVDLNWEVTDLLKTASRQAAGFLDQMRATEALLEARKFEAFNRMSAFVVHDLKNIVAQLSLMLKNAQRLHANPEFQRDMLATVENSLEKMRQLMLQLREGEAPPGGQSGVELTPLVRRIESVAAERGRTVEIDVADAVVTRGHEQRIERVLGHVVQNALDATQPTDRVWLKVSRRSGEARIEVGDTGVGMSQEYVQTRLFKPFQTTKQSGMGIGAYESLQYVRELGGSISVDTELGRGTVMTIGLPLFESRRTSDLQMSGAK
jgi:putative PEP-CTERM system histidine kinase